MSSRLIFFNLGQNSYPLTLANTIFSKSFTNIIFKLRITPPHYINYSCLKVQQFGLLIYPPITFKIISEKLFSLNAHSKKIFQYVVSLLNAINKFLNLIKFTTPSVDLKETLIERLLFLLFSEPYNIQSCQNGGYFYFFTSASCASHTKCNIFQKFQKFFDLL